MKLLDYLIDCGVDDTNFIVSPSGQTFHMSLRDIVECDIPVVIRLLSLRVSDVDWQKSGFYIYLEK